MQDEKHPEYLPDPPISVGESSSRPPGTTGRTSSPNLESTIASTSNPQSISIQRAHDGLEQSAFDLPALAFTANADTALTEVASEGDAITQNLSQLLTDDNRMTAGRGGAYGHDERKRHITDEDALSAQASRLGDGEAMSGSFLPITTPATSERVHNVGAVHKRLRIEPDDQLAEGHGSPDVHASFFDATSQNLYASDVGPHTVSYSLASWNTPNLNEIPTSQESLHETPSAMMSAPQAGPSRWADHSISATSSSHVDWNTDAETLDSILISDVPEQGSSGTESVTAQPGATSQTAPIHQHASGQPTPRSPEPLTAYTCPICFSAPSYPTLTPCGHVCCGECLFTAIRTTMQRATYAVPLRERSIARYVLSYSEKHRGSSSVVKTPLPI